MSPEKAGTKLLCFLQPGINALAAKMKQRRVIHWWKPSWASQLSPNDGRYVRSSGIAAQWMPQAIDAASPVQSAHVSHEFLREVSIVLCCERLIFCCVCKDVGINVLRELMISKYLIYCVCSAGTSTDSRSWLMRLFESSVSTSRRTAKTGKATCWASSGVTKLRPAKHAVA